MSENNDDENNLPVAPGQTVPNQIAPPSVAPGQNAPSVTPSVTPSVAPSVAPESEESEESEEEEEEEEEDEGEESEDNFDYSGHESSFKPSNSDLLLNSLFQKILNQQEETILKNFNILMGDETLDLDAETKNDMMQIQFASLLSSLTQEFMSIFSERDSVEEDDFQRCLICMGDEVPYLKLNCACQVKLHKDCYIEYVDKSRMLRCPQCKKTIFQNYLEL